MPKLIQLSDALATLHHNVSFLMRNVFLTLWKVRDDRKNKETEYTEKLDFMVSTNPRKIEHNS